MADGRDRRDFLKQLVRDVARAASELDEALRDSAEPEESLGSLFPEPAAGEQAVLPAPPTTRTATGDDLRGLCRELGLEPWADAAVAVARASIRLTPATGATRSRLGGAPALPPAFDWPSWDGGPLDLLLQVALDELPPSALPPTGTLLVFFAAARAPDGTRPEHGGACRVALVDGEPPRRERPGTLPEVPLVASGELTLPLEPVDAAAGPCDYEGWLDLRSRLAGLQGIVVADESPDYLALHRLLGHPDALAEPMDEDAALVAAGIDLDSPEADRPQTRAEAPSWRLLAQLSADPSLGVAFGLHERLFVWIREADLRRGRFDRVHAFVR